MGKNANEYAAIRNRIFQLLDEQKISQKEFANMIHVSPQTITDWKKGKSQSFASILEPIAKALSTTPVWLFTGTGDKQVSWDEIERKDNEHAQLMYVRTQQHSKEVKQEFVAAFQQAMKKNGWTASDFDPLALKSIAAECNVSVSELFGEIKKPTVKNDGLTEAEQALMDLFRQLTPDQQDMVIRMVQAAADKQ